jgi:flagellar biosynthetic protein FliS
MDNPAHKAYRRTEVLTANRETILLMMYAGAIRFLKGAIEAGEKGDTAERNRLVSRVQTIVGELRATLDAHDGDPRAEPGSLAGGPEYFGNAEHGLGRGGCLVAQERLRL